MDEPAFLKSDGVYGRNLRIYKEFLRKDWTTKPPTQEGWYWVITPNTYDASKNMDVYYFDGVGWGYTPQEYEYVQSKPTHWLGPLPVPTPPEAE